MTTSPVMTVTDELLAELEGLADSVKGWNMTNAFQEPEEGFLPEDWEWYVGQIDEDDNRYPLMNVNAYQYDSGDSEKLARYYAACNRDTILSMTQELRRLRAENAGLAKDAGRLDLLDSLCESYGFQDVHEGNRWVIDGPFRDIRTASDSLEAQ